MLLRTLFCEYFIYFILTDTYISMFYIIRFNLLLPPPWLPPLRLIFLPLLIILLFWLADLVVMFYCEYPASMFAYRYR